MLGHVSIQTTEIYARADSKLKREALEKAYENIGTPEHCGLVRRDLVVCPPFWLLPRIETGDSFLWACCAPLLRPHPQGNVPAWAFAGRTFRRLWGMSVPFSLSAPLLCQTIVAILCGKFEQFANIAVCVYNVRATSANCISQICRFDRHCF